MPSFRHWTFFPVLQRCWRQRPKGISGYRERDRYIHIYIYIQAPRVIESSTGFEGFGRAIWDTLGTAPTH